MAPLLPTELLLTLQEYCPCRELQLRQLLAFYNGTYSPPPTLVVYGLEATGKYTVVKSVLEARRIPYMSVRCSDCLSPRHLFSRIFAACVRKLAKLEEQQLDRFDRIDSLNSLTVNLQKLLRNHQGPVVLVLDGIDRLRGATPTLLPALARLGDLIPSLSILFTTRSTRPLFLQRAGVPHIHFPPYTRGEAINLVSSSATGQSLLPSSDLLSRLEKYKPVDTTALNNLYTHFAATVYDSLIAPTASLSLPVFRSTCAKLWPRFIWPLLSGETPLGKAQTWDFARLLVRNRALFQQEGENSLIPHLVTPSAGGTPRTFEELADAAAAETGSINGTEKSAPSRTSTSHNFPQDTNSQLTTAEPTPVLLKHFSTLLLVSAYLASHTPLRADMILFSRISASKKSKAQRIRKFSSTTSAYQRRKLFQSPSKSALEKSTTKTPSSAAAAAVKAALALDLHSGVSRPFTLERLTAVLRAIHPGGVPNKRGVADRIYRHLAELERLRLVLPASGAAGAAGVGGAGAGGHHAEDEEKWRINVPRDWVAELARRWGVGFAEFEMR